MILSRFRSLTRFELALWLASMAVVVASFALSGGEGLTLAASLVGVTALIFVARGDVLGQVLTVAFGVLYAVISWSRAYYGEMITYLFMTAPIAVLSIITWLRHPYAGNQQQVAVAHMGKGHAALMFALTALVTFLFFFILRYFHTACLPVSTLSIATSFLASYLMMMRNPFYAIAYAANDVVLIVLWVAASLSNPASLPMVACFAMFLVNDLYGFVSWQRMKKNQRNPV